LPALSDFVLLTCEHGGNRVPAEFARLFRGQRELLESHRGYDPGALELARTCARRLNVPLHSATVTRLLVELNRSPKHPAQFSIATKRLSAADRESLFEKHYYPYRNRVAAEVEKAVDCGRRVIHLSFHTFTPVLDGDVRRADVGLLYDPRRPGETAFCTLFKQSLAARRPELTIRKNYPYQGKTDGFTTTLRRKWNETVYLGIELEVNQRWPLSDRRDWRRLQQDLAEAAKESLTGFSVP
jgi:predicted N-formylglutamate amidohydrolase